jgi:hypothetical protein
MYGMMKGIEKVVIMMAVNCPESMPPIIRLDCLKSKSRPKMPQKPSISSDVIGPSITNKYKDVPVAVLEKEHSPEHCDERQNG